MVWQMFPAEGVIDYLIYAVIHVYCMEFYIETCFDILQFKNTPFFLERISHLVRLTELLDMCLSVIDFFTHFEYVCNDFTCLQ